MANERVERLRAEILGLAASYIEMSQESGLGDSYIRKFACGEIEDLTVTKFDILHKTVKRLKRRISLRSA